MAVTRVRDQLILTSTEGETKRFCGLTVLVAGLEIAGLESVPEACDTEDARPRDLPAPLPEEPRWLLVEAVGEVG